MFYRFFKKNEVILGEKKYDGSRQKIYKDRSRMTKIVRDFPIKAYDVQMF